MYRENPDADFHQMVSDMTGLPRSPTVGIKGNAKQINLGLVFGMGEGKLAQEMGLPYTTETDKSGREWTRAGDEAKEVFRKYHEAVPGVKDLLSLASTRAKSRGHVRTILGRRIRFPGGQYTHKAGGLIFQGSAADALKVKLVEVHEALRGTEARLILNVHDEFDVSAPVGSRDTIGTQVQRVIRHFDGEGTPIKFDVPIMSDLGIGPNWWEASK
jgi:DNA polymerase-1